MTKLHSMQIEQMVLAQMMTTADILNHLDVKPVFDDFYAARHQEIFKAIEILNIQSKPYDFVMVKDYIESTGNLNLIGGEEYLLELSKETASSFFNLGSYVLKLKKLTECRKVEDAGKKIIELAQNTLLEDMPTKAQEIVAGVESVIATNTRFSLQDSSVAALEILERKIAHKKNNTGLAYGVNTGLRDLDAIIGDIEPSHFCVVAAAPGGGKTTLAQMVAINAVKRNNAPTLFFSGEMPHDQVTARILSALGRIPFKNIKNGEMTNEDYSAWVHLTANIFPQYPLEIVDKAGITIAEIRGEIKKTIAKHGRIGCVIVDYLQLVEDHKHKEQFEVITAVSKGLKKIAKDFKCPVIALSQLTKEALGRKLSMSDLRGSGQIAQDADQIIFLYPDTNSLGIVEANVAKNRHGQTGIARLCSNFEFCQFGNIATSSSDEAGGAA